MTVAQSHGASEIPLIHFTSMNTHQIQLALRKRYDTDEWAYFEEVRSETGHSGGTVRFADGMAFNLWPSRGLEVHGFEIKASRPDLLNELKDPNKSSKIQRYCDRWWLVIGDKDLIKEGELPPTWGLIVPHGKGLKVKTQAPKLDSQPIDHKFLVSILRSAKSYKEPDENLKAQLADQYQAGKLRGEAHSQQQITSLEGQLKRVREKVREFEDHSGIKIHVHSWENKDLAKAASEVMRMRMRKNSVVSKATDTVERLRGAASVIEEQLGILLENEDTRVLVTNELERRQLERESRNSDPDLSASRS